MAVDSKPVVVAADAILAQVQSKMRRERLLGPQASAVRFHSGPVRNWGQPPAAGLASLTTMQKKGLSNSGEMAGLVDRLSALDAWLDSDLATAIRAVGDAPPFVTTLRGKAGRVLIHVLKRLLWWYTRSLKTFANSAGKQFECELAALQILAIEHQDLLAKVAELQEEVRQLRQSMLHDTEVGSQ